jgi:hypothetical protein
MFLAGRFAGRSACGVAKKGGRKGRLFIATRIEP